jgi:hypothetical protein
LSLPLDPSRKPGYELCGFHVQLVPLTARSARRRRRRRRRRSWPPRWAPWGATPSNTSEMRSSRKSADDERAVEHSIYRISSFSKLASCLRPSLSHATAHCFPLPTLHTRTLSSSSFFPSSRCTPPKPFFVLSLNLPSPTRRSLASKTKNPGVSHRGIDVGHDHVRVVRPRGVGWWW